MTNLVDNNSLDFVGKKLVTNFCSIMDKLTRENFSDSIKQLAPLAEGIFELLFLKIPDSAKGIAVTHDHAAQAAIPMWMCLSKQSGVFPPALSVLDQRQYVFLLMSLTSLWIKINDKRPFVQELSERPAEALYCHNNSSAASQNILLAHSGGGESLDQCIHRLKEMYPLMATYFTLVYIFEDCGDCGDVTLRTNKVRECWQELHAAGSPLASSTIGRLPEVVTCEELEAQTPRKFNFTTLSKSSLACASLQQRLVDFSTLHLTVWRSLALFSLLQENTPNFNLLTNFFTSSTWATTTHVRVEDGSSTAATVKEIFLSLTEAMNWHLRLHPVFESHMPKDSKPFVPQRVANIVQGVDADPIFLALSAASAAGKDQTAADNRAHRCGEDKASALFDAVVTKGPDEDSSVAENAPMPLAAAALEEVRSTFAERIPRDCDFSGTSSACRDSDQLTRLLRRVMFLPTAASNSTQTGIPVGLMQKIIFQRDGLCRKRRRESDPPAEAIPLLPVSSDLSTMFETCDAAGGEAKTVLEKIASENCWSS